jgi:hypothetical protein
MALYLTRWSYMAVKGSIKMGFKIEWHIPGGCIGDSRPQRKYNAEAKKIEL